MGPTALEALLAKAVPRGERDRLLARVAFEATWERDFEAGTFRWGSGLSLFGYAPEEIVDDLSWWAERIHKGDRERVLANLEELVHGAATVWSSDYRFRRADSSWASVAARGVIERDAQGRAVFVLGAMIDVSRTRELEERLRLFAEQIPARIAASDRALRVLWDLGVGFPRAGKLAGRSIEEICENASDRERLLLASRDAREGVTSKLEVEIAGSTAELRLEPFRDAANQVVGVVAIALDVTERAAAEKRLRDTQRMLLGAQRVGQVRVWEEDLRSGMVKLDVAPIGADAPLFEPRPREEAWSTIPPDDLARLMAMRQRTIETGGPFECEYRMVLPGAAERVLLVRGELVRDAAGRPERILGTTLDLTERKRAEEALEKSQRVLRLVLDTLPVGVIVIDRQGDVMLANAAVLRVWGGVIASGRERWQRSKGTWRDSGKPVEEWASVRALQQGQTSINELIDIEAHDGTRKTIQNSAAPLRDSDQAIVGAVVVNEDVTERVRAETELRKSRQQLIDAQRLAKVGSSERDLRTGVFELSEQARRTLFGDAPGEVRTYEQFLECVHPDDRQRVLAFRDRYLRATVPLEEAYRIVRPDGEVRWTLNHVEVLRDAGGEPIRVLGTNLDITERKRGEEELERRLRQHAAMAQLGQSALRCCDVQPLFEEAVELIARSSNLDFAEVAELLPDETLVLRAARGWKDGVVGTLHLPASTGSLCAFVISNNAPGVVEDFRREVRFTVDPLILEQGIVSHVTVLIKSEGRLFGTLGGGAREPRSYTQHDVNFMQSMANVLASAVERDRVEVQLREQREQMQALSRKLITAQEAERRAVARELHDDFGQVLTAIKHNLQRQERDTTESIALVDGAIARMRDLVQDLRPPLLDELGLESSLRSHVEREASRAGLDFHLDLPALPTRPSPQLETTCFRVAQEALTNVIRHARAHRVEIALRVDGSELVLEVRDDGIGFDVGEARKRAIHGASQGLLSMQERVALAGGALEIDSAPGRGTVVRARLPLGEHRS